MSHDSATTGRVIALAASAILVVLAVGLGVSVAVQGFFDRPPPPAAEVLGKKVGLTQYRLEGASRDSKLTNKEVSHAAEGNSWGVKRSSSAIRVIVRYASEGMKADHTCYQFELPIPLTAEVEVERTRLDGCNGVDLDTEK
ncbi:hypothetical protein ACFQVC_21485 [Streptomyces monticola]|uniref:DUF4307 domain-containing protein n=1 Tax=Streptomyces monticola TaxID=2666263 RepID=A0ABW2JKY7_9ACTN